MATLFTKNQAKDMGQQAQTAYANTKDTAQDILARARETAQSTFKRTSKATQDTIEKVQDTKKVGQDKVQNMLAVILGIASTIGPLLYQNRRKAQEKLKQAQISLTKTTTPIVEQTLDLIATSTKKAGQSFQKAADNTKVVKESLQDRYADYQRKHRRNRVIFRIGLIAGVVLALFYTPIAGSEIRKRIVEQWQRYRPHIER